MPYFQISINDKIEMIGGGALDVLVFGIIRASNTGHLLAQLTGFNKANSEHFSWMHTRLSEHDVVRVDYIETGVSAYPASTWHGEKTGLISASDDKGIGEITHVDAEPMTAHSVFRISLSDGRNAHASGDITTNLQLNVTWSAAADCCKVELGSIKIESDAQSETWIESSLNFGQYLLWGME